MKTKTWKIGEYCKGGIITIEITGTKIKAIGKDWDHSKGTRRSSDQSGAKEFTNIVVVSIDNCARRDLQEFLEDLTTSYYAGQILEWIESKLKFGNSFF